MNVLDWQVQNETHWFEQTVTCIYFIPRVLSEHLSITGAIIHMGLNIFHSYVYYVQAMNECYHQHQFLHV